jgi:hypothetical protein
VVVQYPSILFAIEEFESKRTKHRPPNTEQTKRKSEGSEAEVKESKKVKRKA